MCSGTGTPRPRADACQRLGRAGHHRPAIRRKRIQQRLHAGQHRDPVRIVNLHLFDHIVLGIGVQIGPQYGNGLDAATAVRDLSVRLDRCRAYAPTSSSSAPLSRERRSECHPCRRECLYKDLNRGSRDRKPMLRFYRASGLRVTGTVLRCRKAIDGWSANVTVASTCDLWRALRRLRSTARPPHSRQS